MSLKTKKNNIYSFWQVYPVAALTSIIKILLFLSSVKAPKKVNVK